MTAQLLSQRIGSTLVLVLSNPDARNALSEHLTPALRTQIKERGEDPDVGAILITGAGNAFCSGGDVKGMGGRSARTQLSFEARLADLRWRQMGLTGAMVALRKPTIAALPGAAAGAGLAIALACDVRIAAKSAFVSTGYVRVGLSGDYGGSYFLTRIVGPALARELYLTAELLDSARIQALGLASRVVPDAALEAETMALAHRFASGPRVAYRYIKRNMKLDAATAAADALSRPRFRIIAFAPATTLRIPSMTIASARTVAVVVPSPATSLVLVATSLTS